MSYYRAALAAARAGNLTAAERLVKCSILVNEDAPSASKLHELLQSNAELGTDALRKLRALVKNGKYKKALKIRMPSISKTHTVRGLLYAHLGHRYAAREEFALALALDTGNALARSALLCLADIKGQK